jgi:hypothetical protein
MCGEADFLFAFGHQHQVHRRLPAGAADGVQRGQECSFRSLLVDRAAADQHLAEACLSTSVPPAAARSIPPDRIA